MIKSQLINALNRVNKRRLSKASGGGNTSEKTWDTVSAFNSMALSPNTRGPQMSVSVNASRKQKNKKQGKSQSQQPKQAKVKAKRIMYFAVNVSALSVVEILEATFRGVSSQGGTELGNLYQTLKDRGRVQPKFHVTLVHKNDKGHQDFAAYWADLTSMNAVACAQIPAETLGDCKVHLTNLVWNDNVMAFVVTLSPSKWKSLNNVAHITVGTSDEKIPPSESNKLLQDWNEGLGNYYELLIDEVLEGVVECASFS